MKRGPLRGAAYAMLIEASMCAVLGGAWWMVLRIAEATGLSK